MATKKEVMTNHEKLVRLGYHDLAAQTMRIASKYKSDDDKISSEDFKTMNAIVDDANARMAAKQTKVEAVERLAAKAGAKSNPTPPVPVAIVAKTDAAPPESERKTDTRFDVVQAEFNKVKARADKSTAKYIINETKRIEGNVTLLVGNRLREEDSNVAVFLKEIKALSDDLDCEDRKESLIDKINKLKSDAAPLNDDALNGKISSCLAAAQEMLGEDYDDASIVRCETRHSNLLPLLEASRKAAMESAKQDVAKAVSEIERMEKSAAPYIVEACQILKAEAEALIAKGYTDDVVPKIQKGISEIKPKIAEYQAKLKVLSDFKGKFEKMVMEASAKCSSDAEDAFNERVAKIEKAANSTATLATVQTYAARTDVMETYLARNDRKLAGEKALKGLEAAVTGLNLSNVTQKYSNCLGMADANLKVNIGDDDIKSIYEESIVELNGMIKLGQQKRDIEKDINAVAAEVKSLNLSDVTKEYAQLTGLLKANLANDISEADIKSAFVDGLKKFKEFMETSRLAAATAEVKAVLGELKALAAGQPAYISEACKAFEVKAAQMTARAFSSADFASLRKDIEALRNKKSVYEEKLAFLKEFQAQYEKKVKDLSARCGNTAENIYNDLVEKIDKAVQADLSLDDTKSAGSATEVLLDVIKRAERKLEVEKELKNLDAEVKELNVSVITTAFNDLKNTLASNLANNIGDGDIKKHLEDKLSKLKADIPKQRLIKAKSDIADTEGLKTKSNGEKLKLLETIREGKGRDMDTDQRKLQREIYKTMSLDATFESREEPVRKRVRGKVKAALLDEEAPERATIKDWDKSYAADTPEARKQKKQAARTKMNAPGIDWDNWQSDKTLDPAIQADLNSKMKLAEKVLSIQCAERGMTPPPIKFMKPAAPKVVGPGVTTTKKGHFSPSENAIFLNPDPDGSFADFADLIDTVIHENTHNYQHQLVQQLKDGTLKPDSPLYEQARIFAANEAPGGYVKPEEDQAVYEKQPMEEHAWRAGSEAQEMGKEVKKAIVG